MPHFSCFYQPQAWTQQTRHALWAYRKEPSEPCATDSRRRKPHTKLTAYATFFLLLSAIGMDAADTARIMGISQGAVRTMRHRLKKKEKGENNN
ncbi:tetratricopeptide repeat protein [Prevotella sp. CAG:255]|nr:tetratricopeptide repeat protein [Prevotella sp. CAG:255]